MTDRSDAPSARITLSRVFVGDAVSRVFVGDTVSRFYLDAALAQVRRRVAEPAIETMSGSELVGRDRHGRGNGKRDSVYQRSSRPELGDAEYQSGIAPGVDAPAL